MSHTRPSRRTPFPLLLILGLSVGAVFYLNREVPPQRVSAALATTRLEAAVPDFAEVWSLAERVVEAKGGGYTLRTLLTEVPTDRDAPPASMYLAFRSLTNETDFYIQIDNAALEMVVSASFPTPPQLRNLAAPEAIDAALVRVTLRQATALTDLILAERFPEVSLFEVSADAVLRTKGGVPEWRVSYVTEGEAGPESLAHVVLDARDGTPRPVQGS